MNASSTLIRDGKLSQLAVLLAILMITPQIATLVTDPTHLVADSRAETSEEIESKLYTLYFAEANSSSGGDGHITTMVPESGGQSTSSALEVDWPPDSGTMVVMCPSPPEDEFASAKYSV